MTRQDHRITSAIALALALAATVAPLAWADPPPLAQAEAALAAQHRPACPATTANGANTIASTRATTAPVVTRRSEFDWGDAGIGAGVMVALIILGLAGALATTRRRHAGNSRRARGVTHPSRERELPRSHP
jgi:hypothetical protein